MVKYLAEELSLLLVANNIITIDKRKYYTYGIELILNDLFIVLMVATIALIMDTLLISIIFTCCFCLLRAFVGGYHSETYSRCFLTAMLNYISMLLLNSILGSWKLPISVGMMILSIPVIWEIAPFENINNPFENFEREKYKRISRILLIILSLFFIISLIFLSNEITYVISWSIFATAFLMLLAIKLHKKEEI